MQTQTYRQQIFDYVEKKYKSKIEFPWSKFPNYAVFRHNDNKKWFGLVMNIPFNKLGIDKDEKVDVLNVKMSEWTLKDMLISQNGIFEGYHISKSNWISVLLDGTVPLELVFKLVDESFVATKTKSKTKS